MTDLDLLIDMHRANARQGPGSDATTLRAAELAGLDSDRRLRIADLGCGTGASALCLARRFDAHITAVDAAGPFVEELRSRAHEAGVADRVDARVGAMESLDFDAGEFDVIWSEGAIYTIGFAAGVAAWRRFLRPGGVLAVTELSWTTAERPADVEAHWNAEYPGIDTPSAKLRVLEDAGYAPLGLFVLPRSCWETEYYAPLRAGFGAFLDRHDHGDAARRIVEAEEAEMRLYEERGAWYGYVFYIAQRVDRGA